MKKEVKKAIDKVSLENNDTTRFGDGYEIAIGKVRKAIANIKFLDLVPKLAKDMKDAPIDNLEVHPCMEINEEGDVEQCEPEEAQFWSVYVHYEGGGLDCIADCDTSDQAYELVNFLKELIKRFKKD